jgi:hypothetical protein
MSRNRLIQAWFVAVALIIVASVVLGASVSRGTVAFLVIVCLAPPVMLLMLWPGVQPPTAAEIIRGGDRRD